MGLHHRGPLEYPRHAHATFEDAALALAQPVEVLAVREEPADRDLAGGESVIEC